MDLKNYNNILVSNEAEVTTITINRPKKLNALNKETIMELHQAFQAANADANTRVIVLTGSGKAFVAGADISEFAHFSSEQASELAAKGQALLFDFVESLATPVIAAIHGFALGGGLELAMAAHIRIASEEAKMGLPEVSLGVIPGYGGTQRLPQIIGKSRALECILSADMITAKDALDYGLVNHITKPDELLEVAYKIANKIKRNAPFAISAALQCVQAGYNKDADGFKTEIDRFGKCFDTQDFQEGTTAFAQKRKPEFTGK